MKRILIVVLVSFLLLGCSKQRRCESPPKFTNGQYVQTIAEKARGRVVGIDCNKEFDYEDEDPCVCKYSVQFSFATQTFKEFDLEEIK